MGANEQMKNSLSYQKLEYFFATDFKSPSFIILANKYYNDRYYKKAEKVCKIGLEHDSHNNIAKYILAKIYLINNQLIKAEKVLKDIIKIDRSNINALLVLIDVLKMLKRSSTTIEKYIKIAHSILPDNKSIKNMFDEIKVKKAPSKKISKLFPPVHQPLMDVDIKMATKTMYNLMIKQHKYDLAKHILNVMIKNKQFVSFAKKELKNLQNK